MKSITDINQQAIRDNFFNNLPEVYSTEVYEQVDQWLDWHEFNSDRLLSEEQEQKAWIYFWTYQSEYDFDTF